MTVNEKGLEAAQVAAREGCGLFIESQHVFCDDPVVGEAADGYGKPLRQPYCSCKGDAERIIKAYLRASSNDAEPVAWTSSGNLDGLRDHDSLVIGSMCNRQGDGWTVPLYLTAIEPVAASPGVGEPKLTAYETQVLIGTSISGCNMPPDRVFDLKVAWARLYELGLIDRTDGLAIATPAGASRINAMLAAAPTSPAPSPAGGDVLLADRLLGPVTEAALRLIAGAFRRDGEELGSERRPRFSIPTRPDHDDDCVVIDALKEAARALSSKQRSGE